MCLICLLGLSDSEKDGNVVLMETTTKAEAMNKEQELISHHIENYGMGVAINQLEDAIVKANGNFDWSTEIRVSNYCSNKVAAIELMKFANIKVNSVRANEHQEAFINGTEIWDLLDGWCF